MYHDDILMKGSNRLIDDMEMRLKEYLANSRYDDGSKKDSMQHSTDGMMMMIDDTHHMVPDYPSSVQSIPVSDYRSRYRVESQSKGPQEVTIEDKIDRCRNDNMRLMGRSIGSNKYTADRRVMDVDAMTDRSGSRLYTGHVQPSTSEERTNRYHTCYMNNRKYMVDKSVNHVPSRLDMLLAGFEERKNSMMRSRMEYTNHGFVPHNTLHSSEHQMITLDNNHSYFKSKGNIKKKESVKAVKPTKILEPPEYTSKEVKLTVQRKRGINKRSLSSNDRDVSASMKDVSCKGRKVKRRQGDIVRDRAYDIQSFVEKNNTRETGVKNSRNKSISSLSSSHISKKNMNHHHSNQYNKDKDLIEAIADMVVRKLSKKIGLLNNNR